MHFFLAAVLDAPFLLLAAVEGDDHVVLLAAAQGVVHQVAVGAHPDGGRVPLQVGWKVFFVDHGAVHHMARDPGRVGHELLAHHRLDAIGSDQRAALECLAILVPHGHAVFVLFDAHRPGAGVEGDFSSFLRAFEQRQMHIGAVDDGIGVAKTLTEFFVGGDLAHLVLVDRVVHHHVIGVNSTAPGFVTDTQSVKRMKAVGANLDARADFADFGGLLQHGDGKALTHQSQSCGQAANATACDDDGKLCARTVHVDSSR